MISDDPPGPTPTYEGLTLFISDAKAYEVLISSNHEGVSGFHAFDKEIGKDPTEANCFNKNGEPDFKVWYMKNLDSDFVRKMLTFWVAAWALSIDMAGSLNYRLHMTDELWIKLGGRTPTNRNGETTIGTNIINKMMDFFPIPLYEENEWYLVENVFTPTPTNRD